MLHSCFTTRSSSRRCIVETIGMAKSLILINSTAFARPSRSCANLLCTADTIPEGDPKVADSSNELCVSELNGRISPPKQGFEAWDDAGSCRLSRLFFEVATTNLFRSLPVNASPRLHIKTYGCLSRSRYQRVPRPLCTPSGISSLSRARIVLEPLVFACGSVGGLP